MNASLYAEVGMLSLTDLLEEATAMGIEFSSASFQKFLWLQTNPFTILLSGHPNVSDADKLANLEDVYSLSPCCQMPDSTAKIVKFWPSALALHLDAHAQRNFAMVAKRLRLANMWSERLIAQQHKDIPSGADAEGSMARGYLGTILREHGRIGGTDPRVEHREHLMADGVPLRRSKAETTPRKGGAFFLFKADNETPDKQSRTEYYQHLRRVSQAWRALPEAEVARYEARTRKSFLDKLDDVADQASAEPSPAHDYAHGWSQFRSSQDGRSAHLAITLSHHPFIPSFELFSSEANSLRDSLETCIGCLSKWG